MLKWATETLTRDQKNTQYSKYICHEFNLFLKKHDPAFFESVVKPLLRCKMEKDIVDFYLLKEYDQVNNYIDHTEKLNAMEKCFLIDSLMQSGAI